ncbi:hypothetical protein EF847_07610 [Actinobacteria bacterium YIM 96077]|uniref:Uncharacterized protein n=1 Tax=Phytoactinopolyspora halophila TaxID=1981511 RepID=A0A329QJF6_9ACTN|nr:DUF4097 family beta strand repeat-containing protein [Phytoactinopolyspora halophila]AYY12592.1 hypothetical protein EF847_07610 [Actinobacteria bacterium YIM 96077]RAW12505.1 hypothetical protein DPM12_13980 [Phytoactinopolyspora halophila]
MTEFETSTASTTKTTRRQRVTWLAVGAPLTVVALVVGSLGVVSAWSTLDGAFTETDSSTASYSRAISRLDLDLALGEAHITGGGTEGVEIRRELTWAGTEPTIDETWDGDTLRVDTECPNSFPDWFNPECSIDYTAQVPRTAGADVRTATGRIDVRDLDGEVALVSTTGTMMVDNLGGPLSARATTGDLTGSDLASPEVDTSIKSGVTDLHFTEAPDRITAEATTGQIIIEVPRDDGPYRVDVQTTTGEQRVDVATDPDADRVIGVQTTTGDVHVRYAA